MIVETILFYLFSLILIACGVLVVSIRNPVHAVLFLILAFFNAAGLFLLAGAEFLAMVLVVVYVGAVAVLFLFVVMLLDINFLRLREGFTRALPVGAAVGIILAGELIAGVFWKWLAGPSSASQLAAKTPDPSAVSNTAALGRILYTDYIYLFQSAGLILLVAMIGAIMLTLRRREGVQRQVIGVQNARTAATSVELRKVTTGGGV